MTSIDAIIIGGGPSGIAMAHKLKQKLGFDNFTMYEKLDGPGGTWRTNVYPGCGCDIPTHLYSFSFNLNPRWSKELCDREEILEYMESTVDKFRLRPHMVFNTSCEGATWNEKENKWEVHLLDERTKRKYTKKATIFISAIGSISEPRKTKFPGQDEFQGTIFHTARWNTKYDYRGKRMAVIGNGCSAAQVVPSVVKDVKHVTQYARGQQWYHERPNREFSAIEKFCFTYVPLWQRYHRYQIFSSSDALMTTYGASEASQKQREATERAAREYILATAPKKYHDILIPKFPLGCKRRIFDPGYLEALHTHNMTLRAEGIQKFDATGVVSESGVHDDFDVIVLATGFEVSSFLGPLKVVGRSGIDLHKQWDAHVGAQAYMGMHIHNFPNFALMFGPNTFPAHNSVIFASEVQVDYLAKTLFEPLLDRRARTVEVEKAAEDYFVEGIDLELHDTVFSAGCSNWYINKAGRNSASWPGYAATFWRRTLFPKWSDFKLKGGDSFWRLRRAWRSIVGLLQSKSAIVCYAVGLGFLAKERDLGLLLQEACVQLRN
ncbi:FAD/NAD(P)-binding domain-containing protein [Eremomyces bilateralis CBS 781.70]|uniref:FAD/NAD(P)-binding domain-containing protein n=1 Tax=Eremomyces bilateralis CBS 781.70 TaxID=1392243 RepID=A0A6G1GHK9_9PEZI|nr:FAD/NAD(P)-binding domain-containing protein [Eremomyces bilateralis CBS 781.70]KAF1817472.1 FAD/NAD(P)-binding domain-containing protein [Eremomyces bilateralis CBS 781.70]